MAEDIRWLQRYSNLQKAFSNLESAVELSIERQLSELEKQGLIQSFEFTFELCWKVLKDYLEYMQVDVKFPRDVLKESFKYELISDGDLWMDMFNKRNLMAHTYDEKISNLSFELITTKYFAEIEKLIKLLAKKKNDE